MNNLEHETELAFEWHGSHFNIPNLKVLAGWTKTDLDYLLVDSIYDTEDNSLADKKIGVRVRTKNGKTKITVKKYLGKGFNGEGIYDEYHRTSSLKSHPNKLVIDKVPFISERLKLMKIYQFNNKRREYEFIKDGSLVRLINETVTYCNKDGVYTDHLIEAEFEGKFDAELVNNVKKELLNNKGLSQIHEGKTNRAKRYLELQNDQVLIQNLKTVDKKSMHAHGGKGLIDMWFFHQPYSRFNDDTNIVGKVFDYEDVNWDFFAYAELPIGSEVKKHKHDKTDEIYFILGGSATISINDKERIIANGDCILTRKGSSHSITKVTRTLRFVAIEVHK